MKPIEIFRAGTHQAMSGAKVTITTADLAACASAYDRQLHEAPCVIGHPQTDHPAYGWVAGLELHGDVLVGSPDQLNPEFAQMVESGAFKKRSASFWGPNDSQNPKPGTWYLKHVGFLGAAAPAVPGLKAVQFASSDTAIEFADWQGLSVARLFGNIRDFLIGQFGLEKADAVLSSDDIAQLTYAAAQPAADAETLSPAFSQGDDVTQAEIAAFEADKKKLADQQVEFAQQRKVARLSHITTFVDGLIKDARLSPGHKEPMIAFMATIPADDATFEFAQADGKKVTTDASEWFQGFLKSLPPIVVKGEVAAHRQGENFSQGDPGLDAGKIYAKHNAKRA